MANKFNLKAGDNVDLTNTETGKQTTWSIKGITEGEGGDVFTLTRRAVAPWTSMDRIMGNGPTPQQVDYTRVVKLNEDGTITDIGEAKMDLVNR